MTLSCIVVNRLRHCTACTKYISDQRQGTVLTLPADIREEVGYAGLLLAAASANIRTQVDTRISATDATPSSAGAVRGQIWRQLSEALYRSVHHKGGHRLLVPDQPLDTALLSELLNRHRVPLTEEVVKSVR